MLPEVAASEFIYIYISFINIPSEAWYKMYVPVKPWALAP
jgi:hypothetical protein